MSKLLGFSLCVALLAACATPQGHRVDDAPPWLEKRSKNQARVDMAEELLDAGASREALAVLNSLRADGYTGPEVDLLHGMALWEIGLASEAERMLRAAAERMPRDLRPHSTLGVLYADTGRPEEAIAALERAVAIDPNDASCWNNLGFLYMAQERLPEALEALEQAVALDGTVSRYRNNLGFALAANGRTDDALRAFRSAGAPADAHANLGLAFELSGNSPDAKTQYERALKFNPAHPAANDGLARLSPSEEIP